MQKILISSCFLGNKVRYDGGGNNLNHPQITTWQQQGRLVVVCPEVAGGLSIPRAKAEIVNDKVIDEYGNDVSAQFNAGAEYALSLCQQNDISLALLKENSPSCGSAQVYNGQFKKIKIDGMGCTAKLLTEHGIQVYSELTLLALIKRVQELEP